MAKAQELQLRRMLAKVVVMDSEALDISSVRIVVMAPGEKDGWVDALFSNDLLSSLLLLLLLLSLLSASLVSPAPPTNHSISLSTKIHPNNRLLNRCTILS